MSFAAAEGNAESFETFDSFEEVDAPAEDSSDDDWSKPEPEAEKVKDDLKVLDNSQVDGEGKVIKKDDEKPKKEAKEEKEEEEDEEEESEDEESEESEDEEKKEEEDKPEEKKVKNRKQIHITMDGEKYSISPDATIRHKVDGKMVDIPIIEALNNYSGKVAWDQKFTELGKEKKLIEVEKNTLKTQKDQLLTHLNGALAPLKDPNKNPIDSLLYLVEMSGEDPYTAYRRMMEANAEELGQLLDMTETERELFFHKKKDELHSNVAKKRQEKQQKEQAFNQAVQKVDSLRQAYNVTEEEFVDASEELEALYIESKRDVKSITDEHIVEYASLKPHISKVKSLIEPYEDNISEEKYSDVVAELARYLRDGKADEATVKKILERNFSVEETVKDLNTKVYSKEEKKSLKKKALKEETSEYETFEDWA